MKRVVLINAKAGTASDRTQQACLLDKLRQFPDVEPRILRPHEDITSVARQLVEEGAEAIGVAGGDGTISAAANAIVNTPTVLVPIPFGTLNHFCRDASVSSDPSEAALAILPDEGEEHTIDVGSVNGRFFLNNSSLGLYPHLVERRLKHQEQLGKWPAYAFAAVQLAFHPVQLTVKMPMEESGTPIDVWLIFVSNNVMEAVLPPPGRREHLDRGILHLFVLRKGSALAFLRSTPGSPPMLNEHRLREFTVELPHDRKVRVGCDGEILTLHSPIHYQVNPRSLKLRVRPGKSGIGMD